jgi:hypothetical protein
MIFLELPEIADVMAAIFVDAVPETDEAMDDVSTIYYCRVILYYTTVMIIRSNKRNHESMNP